MNGKNCMIELVTVTSTHDADGFEIENRTSRSVYCNVRSVTGSEFTNAGLLNINAEYDAVIWADEYNGETLVIYDGNEYIVYRTFQPNLYEIELKLQSRAGVKA